MEKWEKWAKPLNLTAVTLERGNDKYPVGFTLQKMTGNKEN